MLSRTRALRLGVKRRGWASIMNLTSQSFTSDATPFESDSCPTVEFVDSSQAPEDFHPDSARVYENFISEEEGQALVGDALTRMRRKRFEHGHWDAVITEYKEVEIPIPSDGPAFQLSSSSRTAPSSESCAAMERVRRHIYKNHFHDDKCGENRSDPGSRVVDWLPCHAIHLRKDGCLTAHVDSVKFSGDIVAGISLLSSSIMRLKPASPGELAQANDTEGLSIYDSSRSPAEGTTEPSGNGKSLENAGHVDLYLPPLSLYILSGVSRYRYTHELLPSGSTFGPNQIIVDRDDRISIIFRDKKQIKT